MPFARELLCKRALLVGSRLAPLSVAPRTDSSAGTEAERAAGAPPLTALRRDLSIHPRSTRVRLPHPESRSSRSMAERLRRFQTLSASPPNGELRPQSRPSCSTADGSS